MDDSYGRLLTRWFPEIATAVALLVLPFGFDAWLGSVDLFTRILIWGIFGLGFDLLFGRTGLLSFGQAAFYGAGGFVTAYLLTSGTLGSVWLALAAGIAAAMAFSLLVGFLALRRVGIYFTMITLAFGELSYFLENSPLSRVHRRRERLAWRAGAEHSVRRDRLQFCRLLAELPTRCRIFFHWIRVCPLRCAVSGRRGADRDPTKSGTYRRARPRCWRLQARCVRPCGGLRRRRRRAARHFPELYAAGRLRARHLRTAGHSDRDGRRRHPDRTHRWRRDLADLCATCCSRCPPSAAYGNSFSARCSFSWSPSCRAALSAQSFG